MSSKNTVSHTHPEYQKIHGHGWIVTRQTTVTLYGSSTTFCEYLHNDLVWRNITSIGLSDTYSGYFKEKTDAEKALHDFREKEKKEQKEHRRH